MRMMTRSLVLLDVHKINHANLCVQNLNLHQTCTTSKMSMGQTVLTWKRRSIKPLELEMLAGDILFPASSSTSTVWSLSGIFESCVTRLTQGRLIVTCRHTRLQSLETHAVRQASIGEETAPPCQNTTPVAVQPSGKSAIAQQRIDSGRRRRVSIVEWRERRAREIRRIFLILFMAGP